MNALITLMGGMCLAAVCYGAWLHAELTELRHELDTAQRQILIWRDSAENWRKAAKLSEQTGKGLEANARACLEREAEAARRLAEALEFMPPQAAPAPDEHAEERNALVDALNRPLAPADGSVRQD